MWQVDKNIVDEVKVLEKLGVCQSHFMFDQNQLHEKGAKKEKDFQESIIHHRRCLYCKQIFYFFARGKSCTEHSRSVAGKLVQVPCIGHLSCSALSPINPIIFKTTDAYRASYICISCYEKNGGHLHVRPGRNWKNMKTCLTEKKHDDVSQSLKIIGDWIINVAESDNMENKKILYEQVFPLLSVLNSNPKSKISNQVQTFINSQNITSNSTHKTEKSSQMDYPLSSFAVLTIMKLYKIPISKNIKTKLNQETCYQFGKDLANDIWKSKQQIKSQDSILQSPHSLIQYHQAFPTNLSIFCDSLIENLFQKKLEVAKRTKNYKLDQHYATSNASIKISVLLMSVIITTAFKKFPIWLTTILSSLCRKPNLISLLYRILETVNVVSHTRRHERRLEKARMFSIEPEKRLCVKKTLWNVCIIDNIDFKDKTFKYGNIFNTTRNSWHATLRMVFQFNLPIDLNQIPCDEVSLNEELIIFGENSFSHTICNSFNHIFKELLNYNSSKFNDQFDSLDIHKKILENVEYGSQGPIPNIVILRPGGTSNTDDSIFETCNQYKTDLNLENNEYCDICADEAIFRRIIRCKEKNKKIRPLLGQWHTSKDMCSVLLTIFSGYGIFQLATELGVEFLDKLESVTDYRATCRVLEFLWSAVGIAIHLHIAKKNITIENIMEGSNNFLKVWYLFYHWTSLWKAHKIGIRTGNYDMQYTILAAFAPLFPIAGKNRYSQSVVHFLSELAKHPGLQTLLRHYCSANLTKKGHYLAFDEALETYGVKFVKQNLTGIIIDNENLATQIASAQAENDRIDALYYAFVDDIVMSESERTINTRKDSIWSLVYKLDLLFNSTNPQDDKMFKFCSQLNDSGYNLLFGCYENGYQRLLSIFRQEILHVEPINTKGRGVKGVGTMKVQSFKDIAKKELAIEKEQQRLEKLHEKEKKQVKKRNVSQGDKLSGPSENQLVQHSLSLSEFQEMVPSPLPPPKRIKIAATHITTDAEKEILKSMLHYQQMPPGDVLQAILEKVQEIDDGHWTMEKVKRYWRNNKGRQVNNAGPIS